MIDCNVYWFDERIFESNQKIEEFLSSVPNHYDTNAYVKKLEDGRKQIVIERPKGYENLNYLQGEYQLDSMLSDMDNAHINQAILKIPGCHEWLSLEQCKKFNDGMFEYMKNSEGRLIPLAVVPPNGSQAVFEEIERCLTELEFPGIQLVAHYGNHYLDDQQFSDFFEKLNKLRTVVYVHHTPVPTQYDALIEYTNMRRSYGRCADQLTAVCRELYSGFFDKYPDLTFVHSMLGGGFFALKNMLIPRTQNASDTVQRFSADKMNIAYHLENNVFFEMSHAQPWGKDTLEYAVKVLGADHIIFGSSYPVRREWLTEGAQFIRDLTLTPLEKDLILSKNARRIYRLKNQEYSYD